MVVTGKSSIYKKQLWFEQFSSSEKRQSGRQGVAGNHIASYKTDKRVLVRQYAQSLFDILNMGSRNVNNLRQKLEEYSDANSRDPPGFKKKFLTLKIYTFFRKKSKTLSLVGTANGTVR